jgi:hypothetical protein
VTSEVLSAADGLEESTEGSYVAGRHRGEGTTLSDLYPREMPRLLNHAL